MSDYPSTPFRREDERRFDRYARNRQTRRFDAVAAAPDESDVDFFKTSQLGMWHYLGKNHGLRRADGKPFRCYAGFVDKLAPNAFADLQGDTHVIGIHSGLGVAMFELALFCCSQADFFPEIGDPSVETSPDLPEGSPLSFLMVDLSKVAEWQKLRDVANRIMPRDAHRCLLAHLVTQMLLRFVWFHEHYHCVNGHVGLLKGLGITPTLNEVPDGQMKSAEDDAAIEDSVGLDATMVRRCLELDADRSAFWACCKIQLANSEVIEAMRAMPLRQRMKIVMFSAFVITYFFDARASQVPNTAQTHPSGYIRLHNLIRTAASHLTDEYPETRSVYQDVLREFRNLDTRIKGLFSIERMTAGANASTLDDVVHHDIESSLKIIKQLISVRQSNVLAFYPTP